MPKIIQINTIPIENQDGYLLLGLDDRGAVWWWDSKILKWQKEATSLLAQGEK